MRYRCENCGRTVDLPEGNYTCKVCGSPLRSVEEELVRPEELNRLAKEIEALAPEYFRGFIPVMSRRECGLIRQQLKEVKAGTRKLGDVLAEHRITYVIRHFGSESHHSDGMKEIEPFYKGLKDEVISAIAKEKDVIDDYGELENKLREKGLNYDAGIVTEIRNDEIDHLVKFEAMRKRLSP